MIQASSLTGSSYGQYQASGKKPLRFGAAAQKKEAPPTRIPETEEGFLSRIASRVTQFFKDIANAFGHLFSWRSAKEEVQRSAVEFLNRPEIKPVFNWVMREVNPKGETLKHREEVLKAIEKDYPKTYRERPDYKALAQEHRELVEALTPQGFAKEIVDHFSEGYEEQLKEQEAEKKSKAQRQSRTPYTKQSGSVPSFQNPQSRHTHGHGHGQCHHSHFGDEV